VVKGERVALEPVKAFLEHTAKFPIRGDDPRNPAVPRVFSVAPIPSSGPVSGYLYVVLAGERPAGLIGALASSDIVPRAAAVAGLSVLLALIAGLALFAVMTRRLERLAGAMDEFQRRDFSVRPEALSVARARDGDEIDRLTSTFREMALRIAGQLQRLRQNDQLRRELVANVSHDLKTPIATLQGYVDTLLLKDAALSSEQRQSYLSIASRSCERLGKLVGDLIELAKLEAKEIALAREAFSIGELIQDVLQKFQLNADQKQVRLELDFPERLPYVSGDIGLIERVLENLIGNALAYTSTGGFVRLSVSVEDTEATVHVSDSGRGIARDDLAHVFERFYRVSNADWEKGAHAGLGLAITKSILDLHCSRLTVDSQLGVGTNFHFTLPTAVFGAQAARPATEAAALSMVDEHARIH
jgi:signal transduction histidine kinase